MGEMDADLVHAAGLGKGTEEGEGGMAGEPADDAEMGARRGAGGVDGLLEVNAGRGMDALAEEGGVDGECVGGGPAIDEGVVLL